MFKLKRHGYICKVPPTVVQINPLKFDYDLRHTMKPNYNLLIFDPLLSSFCDLDL